MDFLVRDLTLILNRYKSVLHCNRYLAKVTLLDSRESPHACFDLCNLTWSLNGCEFLLLVSVESYSDIVPLVLLLLWLCLGDSSYCCCCHCTCEKSADCTSTVACVSAVTLFGINCGEPLDYTFDSKPWLSWLSFGTPDTEPLDYTFFSICFSVLTFFESVATC